MKTIVVLGMHRSATSLIAKGLNHEAYMGDIFLRSTDNPEGHFENKSFLRLNKNILQAAGGSWHEPPTEQAILAVRKQFKHRIKTLIATSQERAKQKNKVFWGWKDPRNCLTIKLYMPYLPNPHFAVVYRNPNDIAISLNKRNGFPIEKGLALCKEYNRRIFEFITEFTK